ncbi:PQQ-like beta-propeller repeat protein, partial [bacterium]|nr:PQQ-like beta-propeller repeat protein [bacterium]
NTTRVVVTEGKAYLHSIGNLQCLDLTRKAQLETLLNNQRASLKKLDPKVETNLAQIEVLKKEISTLQTQIKSCLLWTIAHPSPFELVVAGAQLIVGLDNQVSILDIKTGKPLWQHKVTGRAYGLTPAEGRLIVSTDLGYIHTFHKRP